MAIKRLAGPDQPKNLQKLDFLEDFEGFPASKRGPNGYKKLAGPILAKCQFLFRFVTVPETSPRAPVDAAAEWADAVAAAAAAAAAGRAGQPANRHSMGGGLGIGIIVALR